MKMKKKPILNILGGLLLIMCIGQNASAQVCWDCYPWGPGGCLTCLWIFDGAGDECTEINCDLCDLGHICLLPPGACQDTNDLRQAQLEFDEAMIRRVADSNPRFAVALAVLNGKTFKEGRARVLIGSPVDISAAQVEYWLKPRSKEARAYFAKYHKEAQKLILRKAERMRLEISLDGNELHMKAVSGSKPGELAKLIVPLRDTNFASSSVSAKLMPK